MTASKARMDLKKPLPIYLLAICFIVAPLANILASMVSFGVHHWYSPSTFLAFVERISWIDRGWLALTLIAGIALLKQSKWPWLLSILALAVASVFNLYYGMKFNSHLARGKGGDFFPLLFTLSNLALIVILYYFRFPYLDRREAWWGIQRRYGCDLPASAGEIKGAVTNISLSGAFFQAAPGSFKNGDITALDLDTIAGLKTEVVHATERGYGLRFKATSAQKLQIKQLIASLSANPSKKP